MRKYAISAALPLVFTVVAWGSIFDAVPPAANQPLSAPAGTAPAGDAPVRVTTTTSLTAVKMQSKLSDPALFKSVLDYSFPQELSGAAEKCRQGETDECYFSYKGFEQDSNAAVAAAANRELAVLSVQRGLLKQALKHARQAAKLLPDDPYPVLQSGWILLEMGKYKKARQAFADVMYLTADFEYVSSAKLGSAVSFYLAKDYKKAAEALQYLYTADPYSISLTAYLLGASAVHIKGSARLAPVFLQQALEHDSNNYAAVKLLASLAEKNKNTLQAWQYYATLHALDPQNERLAQKTAKYQKELGAKAEDYLYYLRLETPIAARVESVNSPTVRMALYGLRGSPAPAVLQSVKLVASGPARVQDEKLGTVKNVAAFQLRQLVYNPQTNAVDIMDGKGQVEFSAKRPFTFVLEQDDRTLLVRDAQMQDLFAADLSDKELKGALTVIPQAGGMTLINTVRAEDLVPALLAARAQDVREEEALRALAVVLRSALLAEVETNPQAAYHITDNSEVFKFNGINLVFPNLLEAARQSAGVRLLNAVPGVYADCGPLGADTITNTQTKPAYAFSPANAAKYMLANPPADLVSKPQDSTQWSGVKWAYWIDAKDVEERLAQKTKFGRLRALEPLKRTANGRILTLRFTGSKGEYVAQTPQEISFLLGAGSLRSDFFDAAPFYKGKNIRSLLIRGYDTGLGTGLCLQGAQGLAKPGLNYLGIIKYYFPEARLLDTKTGKIN